MGGFKPAHRASPSHQLIDPSLGNLLFNPPAKSGVKQPQNEARGKGGEGETGKWFRVALIWPQ